MLSIQVDPSNWLLCKTNVVKDPNQPLTGISNKNKINSQIKMYPNPANDLITIEMNSNILPVAFQIIDAYGKTITLKSETKISANDKIRIALIGSGIIGHYDADTAMKVPGVDQFYRVIPCDHYPTVLHTFHRDHQFHLPDADQNKWNCKQ